MLTITGGSLSTPQLTLLIGLGLGLLAGLIVGYTLGRLTERFSCPEPDE